MARVRVQPRMVAAFDRLDMVLPRDPNSSGTARHAAATFLGGRCSAKLLSDVLIVISELVTNAVSHTGGGCELTVHHRDHAIVVEVRDNDTLPSTKSRSDDESLGRGLGVVQSLTLRWGIERLVDGKCVWAELAVPIA